MKKIILVRAEQIRIFWISLSDMIGSGRSLVDILVSSRGSIFCDVEYLQGRDSFDDFIYFIITGLKNGVFSNLYEAINGYSEEYGFVFISPAQLAILQLSEASGAKATIYSRIGSDWGDSMANRIGRLYLMLYDSMKSGVGIVPALEMSLDVFGFGEFTNLAVVDLIRKNGKSLSEALGFLPSLHGSYDLVFLSAGEVEGEQLEALSELARLSLYSRTLVPSESFQLLRR